LQKANERAPAGANAHRGEEVLQFFIGRNHLYLEQDVAAESAFTQSLALNPNYARAHIGLGGVYYQRAFGEKPEERLDKPELQAALTEYQKALDEATGLGDQNVATKAKLSLAYTYRLYGESYLTIDDSAKAEQAYKQAIALTDEIIPALEKQYRLLGQLYALRGSAYYQMAYIPADQATVKGLLNMAFDEFGKCIMQGNADSGDPNDSLLKDKIIGEVCIPTQKQVREELDKMP
jgi:tetratricopeptide (TPR) repeat protein